MGFININIDMIKNSYSSVILAGLALILTVFVTSCDLTNEVNSQVTAEDFFQTRQQFTSALGDAYNPMTDFGTAVGPSTPAEVLSDEIIVPGRAQDWSEGGFWARLHDHTWTFESGAWSSVWQSFFTGVNNANRLIFQIEQAVEEGAADEELATQFLAELKSMRAFYYFWLLDSFGNVPILTSFADAPENPTQPCSSGPVASEQCFNEGRQEVFNFVETQLLDNIDALSEDKQATYGRMNKWVAHMTLAKLYMMSEAYTGTPRWDDALTHLNAIINSGQYSLASNYSSNFSSQNQGSPENIFVVPFDQVFLQGFNLNVMTLHYANQSTYQFQTQPWNGFSATTKAYKAVIDTNKNPGPTRKVWGFEQTSDPTGLEQITGTDDDRYGNFIVGPQFSAGGEQLTDGGVFSDFDKNGAPITFVPVVNDLERQACRQCGARIGKYEFESGIGANMNNDMVIFRYSDVLLLKAEALWRQNPSSPEALALVNQVRTRAGVDPFSSLDADKILAERMREFFWEMTRRQDLLRFEGEDGGETRFNDPWKYKEVSPPFRNVGPIPEGQLQANSALVQNPGYSTTGG